MPGFRRYLADNGIQGDPNQLVNDPDLATQYAASGYLGQAIKRGQQMGLHGAQLATYAQQTGQVSVSPERSGQNYQRLFAGGDPYGEALAAAQPSAGARARSNARIPPGHYDGDGHDHGVATPYTQQQVSRDGTTYTIAFDFDAPYDQPFDPAIPRHRGVDLQPTGAPNGGENLPYTAFRDGQVVKITNDPHGGIGIIVATGDPSAPYDRYFHNNAVSVREGDYVRAGMTPLGVIGQTGTEGFPHLHYEVSRNIDGDPMGQTIDPRPYMGPPPGRAPTSGRAAPQAQAQAQGTWVTDPGSAFPRWVPAAEQPRQQRGDGGFYLTPPAAPARPNVTTLDTPYTSGRRQTTDGIVIHATRGNGETPQAEFEWTQRWFGQNPYQVSANAVIGPDGTIAMPRDWDLITHHAGENNATKFGIELAQSAADSARNVPYTDAQYQSLGWLLGELTKRYGIPLDREHVVGHEELEQGRRQNKTDPGPNFDWNRALQLGTATMTPVQMPRIGAPGAGARQDPGFSIDPRTGRRAAPTTGQGEGVPAPAVSYTVGGRPATREEYEQSVADAREKRAQFEATLDPHTKEVFQEWAGARDAARQGLSLDGFRAHLGRIGAPDPWTQREQQAAAQAAAADRQAQAPRVPAAGQGAMVYTYQGQRISEAQYNELQRQAAAEERIVGAYNQRAAAANAEIEAVRTWERRRDAYNRGDDMVGDPGPRPATPNYDYLQAEGLSSSESAAPREQTGVQKADLAAYIERAATGAEEG